MLIKLNKYFLTRFIISQVILFYSHRCFDRHRWSSLGRVSSHKRGGLRLEQSARHAIWRPVKILVLMKPTDGGRKVDVSKKLLVVK